MLIYIRNSEIDTAITLLHRVAIDMPHECNMEGAILLA